MSEIRCTHTTDIGAYLLGGLSADEAVVLRHHIDTCPTCTDALNELKPITEQLGAIDLRSFAGMTIEAPPDDLRDRILQTAAADLDTDVTVTPLRRRVAPWKVAAAAAAVFAVGTGTGWSAHLAAAPADKAPPTTRRVYWGTGNEAIPQKVKFVSAATSPTKAWAAISSGPAGTYAALYTKGLSAGTTYKWWFEKKDGTRVGLGSFVFPAGQTDWVVCPGGTSIERVELKAIGATDPNGVDVLRANLPEPATS
jgi:hypothetical protein